MTIRFFKRILSSLIIPTILAGCANDVEMNQVQNSILHEVVFHAGWDPETRTVIQNDSDVLWSPMDSIYLWSVKRLDASHFKNSTDKFVSTNNTNTSETEFIGVLSQPDATYFYALYPYGCSGVSAGTYPNLFFEIPSIQTAVPDSFDPSAFVSYAKADDNHNLYFRNICGGIKFSVSQEGIKEVTFQYGNGKAIAGRFRFNVKTEETVVQKKAGSVTVRAIDDSCFEVGKYYYAVLYPSESASPLLVTYKKESSQAMYKTEGPTSISRSVFKRLLNKDEGLLFIPKKNGAIMKSTLPDRFFDFRSITEVIFHPSSDHVTNVNLGTTDSPVYFELEGNTVHYYTPMEYFNIKEVSAEMFFSWESLVRVDFNGVDTSESTDFSRFFATCPHLESIDLSRFDTSCAYTMTGMFSGCRSLTSLDLSSFNTALVTNMSGMFGGCLNLRELDLSNFETTLCTNVSEIFSNCISLQKLDLSQFDITSIRNYNGMCEGFATRRKSCIVRASDATWSMMTSAKAFMPFVAKLQYITRIKPGEEFPILVDPLADLYKSTDYSKDGTYTLLHQATKGNGIDLVFMGAAYSDRLINNGVYDSDISRAIEAVFKEDPIKLVQDYFNIYITYVVSENETIEGVNALDVYIDYAVYEEVPISPIIDGGMQGQIDNYMRATLPDYGYEELYGRSIPGIVVLLNSPLEVATGWSFPSGTGLLFATSGTSETTLRDSFYGLNASLIDSLACEVTNL